MEDLYDHMLYTMDHLDDVDPETGLLTERGQRYRDQYIVTERYIREHEVRKQSDIMCREMVAMVQTENESLRKTNHQLNDELQRIREELRTSQAELRRIRLGNNRANKRKITTTTPIPPRIVIDPAVVKRHQQQTRRQALLCKCNNPTKKCACPPMWTH